MRLKWTSNAAFEHVAVIHETTIWWNGLKFWLFLSYIKAFLFQLTFILVLNWLHVIWLYGKYYYCQVAPVSFAINVYMSACSSITISVDFPAPCPALTSILPSKGLDVFVAVSWSAAKYFKEWCGTTRSSWSAVVTYY